MAISETWLSETCKFGKGEETCAFLTMGTNGFQCAKGTPIQAVIQTRLDTGTFNAKGNNCAGWAVIQELGADRAEAS